jgi:hypothetical protein
MLSVDELLDMAIGLARAELIGNAGAEIMPTFVIQGKDKTTFVGTPWSGDAEKEYAITAIRALLKKERAVSYSFISEAWLSTQQKGEPYIQPRLSDKRREVVICNAFNRHGDGKMRCYEIKRDNQGVVADLVLDSDEFSQKGFSGRLFNLFEDRS